MSTIRTVKPIVEEVFFIEDKIDLCDDLQLNDQIAIVDSVVSEDPKSAIRIGNVIVWIYASHYLFGKNEDKLRKTTTSCCYCGDNLNITGRYQTSDSLVTLVYCIPPQDSTNKHCSELRICDSNDEVLLLYLSPIRLLVVDLDETTAHLQDRDLLCKEVNEYGGGSNNNDSWNNDHSSLTSSYTVPLRTAFVKEFPKETIYVKILNRMSLNGADDRSIAVAELEGRILILSILSNTEIQFGISPDLKPVALCQESPDSIMALYCNSEIIVWAVKGVGVKIYDFSRREKLGLIPFVKSHHEFSHLVWLSGYEKRSIFIFYPLLHHLTIVNLQVLNSETQPSSSLSSSSYRATIGFNDVLKPSLYCQLHSGIFHSDALETLMLSPMKISSPYQKCLGRLEARGEYGTTLLSHNSVTNDDEKNSTRLLLSGKLKENHSTYFYAVVQPYDGTIVHMRTFQTNNPFIWIAQGDWLVRRTTSDPNPLLMTDLNGHHLMFYNNNSASVKRAFVTKTGYPFCPEDEACCEEVFAKSCIILRDKLLKITDLEERSSEWVPARRDILYQLQYDLMELFLFVGLQETFSSIDQLLRFWKGIDCLVDEEEYESERYNKIYSRMNERLSAVNLDLLTKLYVNYCSFLGTHMEDNAKLPYMAGKTLFECLIPILINRIGLCTAIKTLIDFMRSATTNHSLSKALVKHYCNHSANKMPSTFASSDSLRILLWLALIKDTTDNEILDECMRLLSQVVAERKKTAISTSALTHADACLYAISLCMLRNNTEIGKKLITASSNRSVKTGIVTFKKFIQRLEGFSIRIVFEMTKSELEILNNAMPIASALDSNRDNSIKVLSSSRRTEDIKRSEINWFMVIWMNATERRQLFAEFETGTEPRFLVARELFPLCYSEDHSGVKTSNFDYVGIKISFMGQFIRFWSQLCIDTQEFVVDLVIGAIMYDPLWLIKVLRRELENNIVASFYYALDHLAAEYSQRITDQVKDTFDTCNLEDCGPRNLACCAIFVVMSEYTQLLELLYSAELLEWTLVTIFCLKLRDAWPNVRAKINEIAESKKTALLDFVIALIKGSSQTKKSMAYCLAKTIVAIIDDSHNSDNNQKIVERFHSFFVTLHVRLQLERDTDEHTHTHTHPADHCPDETSKAWSDDISPTGAKASTIMALPLIYRVTQVWTWEFGPCEISWRNYRHTLRMFEGIDGLRCLVQARMEEQSEREQKKLIVPALVTVDLKALKKDEKKCFLCHRSFAWTEFCEEVVVGRNDYATLGGRVVCCAGGHAWWHEWCYALYGESKEHM